MSCIPLLPTWVSYFQALAVPILGAIVGIFTILISRQSARIAHDKLQQEVFDKQWEKRFAVYVATRDFLKGAHNNTISEIDAQTYGLRALEAQFLFDKNMYNYLRELHFHGTVLSSTTLSIDHLPPGPDREAQEEIRSEHLAWIRQQGDEKAGFSIKFAPFLKQQRVRRSWLLC